MGPHDEYRTPVLMVNGVDYAPTLAIPELALDGDAEREQKVRSLDGESFSFSCRLNGLRCKSRKRFVKLLMSNGVPKRKAEVIADGVCLVYGSYQMAWRAVFWTGTVRYVNIEKLKHILRREVKCV